VGGNQPRYYAYGRERTASLAALPTDYTFTGQKLDGTGLVYMNARYYDPQLGTFISPDSLVPDATSLADYNRYMYASGNPVKFVDPTGHDSCNYVEGSKGVPGTIQCNPTPVIGGLTLTIDPNKQSCFKNCQSLTDILAKTFADLKDAKIEIGVTYDEHGLPQLVFDKNKVAQIITAPLRACASAIGGACGISVGGSANAYGGGGRFDGAIYVDQQGIMGAFVEGGGGGYTPLPSPVAKLTVTGIPGANVFDLDGLSAQFGGSGAIGPWGGSAEAVFLKADSGTSLHGQSYGYAYNDAIALEAHLTLTWAQPVAYLMPNGNR